MATSHGVGRPYSLRARERGIAMPISEIDCLTAVLTLVAAVIGLIMVLIEAVMLLYKIWKQRRDKKRQRDDDHRDMAHHNDDEGACVT